MFPPSAARSRTAGASLVDVMFAISIVAFACAAMFLLYSNALQLLSSQQTTRAATLLMQDRLEQLRLSNWDALCNVTALTTLLRTQPASAALLPGLVEEVAVSTYPAVAGRVTRLRRATNGTVSTVSSYTSLAAAPLVRVDVRATWQSRRRTHVRENSLLIPVGGLAQ